MATKPSKTELARLANDLLRSMRAAATLYAQAKQNKENELVSTRLLSETANKAAKFVEII